MRNLKENKDISATFSSECPSHPLWCTPKLNHRGFNELQSKTRAEDRAVTQPRQHFLSALRAGGAAGTGDLW